MGKWIRFLVLPILIFFIIDFVSREFIFNFFSINIYSFWGGVLRLVIYAICGMVFFNCSPNYKALYAYVYVIAFSILISILSIETYQQVVSGRSKFLTTWDIAPSPLALVSDLVLILIGLIVGIYFASDMDGYIEEDCD